MLAPALWRLAKELILPSASWFPGPRDMGTARRKHATQERQDAREMNGVLAEHFRDDLAGQAHEGRGEAGPCSTCSAPLASLLKGLVGLPPLYGRL